MIKYHANVPKLLENTTTEPHAHDISVWLSGYILQQKHILVRKHASKQGSRSDMPLSKILRKILIVECVLQAGQEDANMEKMLTQLTEAGRETDWEGFVE